MITADELQSNLQLIDHHVDSVCEALEVGEDDIIEASLEGIKELTAELRSYLPERYALTVQPDENIDTIADGVEDL